MGTKRIRLLAILIVVLALGTIALGLESGGNVLLIALGLLLAALSMELFRIAEH